MSPQVHKLFSMILGLNNLIIKTFLSKHEIKIYPICFCVHVPGLKRKTSETLLHFKPFCHIETTFHNLNSWWTKSPAPHFFHWTSCLQHISEVKYVTNSVSCWLHPLLCQHAITYSVIWCISAPWLLNERGQQKIRVSNCQNGYWWLTYHRGKGLSAFERKYNDHESKCQIAVERFLNCSLRSCNGVLVHVKPRWFAWWQWHHFQFPFIIA